MHVRKALKYLIAAAAFGQTLFICGFFIQNRELVKGKVAEGWRAAKRMRENRVKNPNARLVNIGGGEFWIDVPDEPKSPAEIKVARAMEWVALHNPDGYKNEDELGIEDALEVERPEES